MSLHEIKNDKNNISPSNEENFWPYNLMTEFYSEKAKSIQSSISKILSVIKMVTEFLVVRTLAWTGMKHTRVYYDGYWLSPVSFEDLIKDGEIKPGRALDIGCGRGDNATMLAIMGVMSQA